MYHDVKVISDSAAMWAVWHGSMYLQTHPYAICHMHAREFASRNYMCALNACMKHLPAEIMHVRCVHAWSAA